ncbi:disulfide bond formation protein B [Lysobacter pythonis]|uniref:Disulfide bond formation protein B n=1 Tax=Solilutibacter pythonis TaxID=2483112 RepID=A0A3M2HIH9_9GAMM|nr:disulfide bond formation protein B [Lysobacter pythonis]RMH89531.1 disulfide bond formation protein B [Lysobacter pythonis]
MNPLQWSFRTRFLLGFLACAGLIGYALILQEYEGLIPCDFCIMQRIAFAAVGTVMLAGGVHAPKSLAMRRTYGVLAMLAAVVGGMIAGRHVWVQLYPPEISNCGAGMGFVAEMQGWPGAIRKVLTAGGDCSNIDWTFLGLTMPMWSLIWFALLGAWALLAAFGKARAR